MYFSKSRQIYCFLSFSAYIDYVNYIYVFFLFCFFPNQIHIIFDLFTSSSDTTLVMKHSEPVTTLYHGRLMKLAKAQFPGGAPLWPRSVVLIYFLFPRNPPACLILEGKKINRTSCNQSTGMEWVFPLQGKHESLWGEKSQSKWDFPDLSCCFVRPSQPCVLLCLFFPH